MKRRDFLKKGALAAAGAGLLGSGTTLAKGLELTDDRKSVNFNVNGKARMHLSFEPYELKLKHVFTVSSFSRSTTPDVQVRIDYDGYTGYGEASMPPYLGQTVESVCSFLKKVDLEQFPDPFCIEIGRAHV